jgi:hypothetical protein
MDPNQTCLLCNACDEDVWHLLTECPFTREVFRLIWQWCSLACTPTPVSPELSTSEWLTCCVVVAKPRPQRETMSILLYMWWNVWKECNRRVFESTQKSELQVVALAKEDIDLFIFGSQVLELCVAFALFLSGDLLVSSASRRFLPSCAPAPIC